MSQDQQPIVVGKIGACYGVKGWMKITAYTESQEGIFDYSPWLLQEHGKWREIKVKEWRFHGKTVIAELEGITSREQAQALTNCEIGIDAAQMSELPADEFYWRDLIGCNVINSKGYNMGIVDQILETGSNDVLMVKANAKDAFGKTERMIPFVTEQFILEVDVTAKQILVDWDPDF